jgi:hypothetical protein
VILGCFAVVTFRYRTFPTPVILILCDISNKITAGKQQKRAESIPVFKPVVPIPDEGPIALLFDKIVELTNFPIYRILKLCPYLILQEQS